MGNIFTGQIQLEVFWLRTAIFLDAKENDPQIPRPKARQDAKHKHGCVDKRRRIEDFHCFAQLFENEEFCDPRYEEHQVQIQAD